MAPNSLNGQPGSQGALRHRNIELVFSSLISRGPQVQAELARNTGLSSGSISSIVRELIDQGRVETKQTVSSGRRAVMVEAKVPADLLAGIDIGRTHLSMSLARRNGEEVVTRDVRLTSNHIPEETLRTAHDLLVEMLEEAGARTDSISACVVSLPASVTPDTNEIVQDTVFSSWSGRNLLKLTEETLGLSVVLDNDANLGALAQVTYGSQVGAHSVLYVKIASGIGAGLVVGADRPQIYATTTGLSGEMGHARVVEAGEICYCGNRGCLEVIASTNSLVQGLDRIRPGKKHTVDDLIAGLEEGDPVVFRMIADAGEAIGDVLALLVNVLAPDAVVLGGPLAPAGEPLLRSVSAVAKQRLIPALIDKVDFEVTDLGTRSEVLGCIARASQIADKHQLGLV